VNRSSRNPFFIFSPPIHHSTPATLSPSEPLEIETLNA
jgi:hypothetical protein